MSTARNVEATILGIIGSELRREVVRREDRFAEDLGVDSFAVEVLVMGVEDEFGIAIPVEDVDGLRTVGDLITHVERRIGGSPSPAPRTLGHPDHHVAGAGMDLSEGGTR